MGLSSVLKKVDFALSLNQALWAAAFKDSDIQSPHELPAFPHHRLTTTERLRRRLGEEQASGLDEALETLENQKLCFRFLNDDVVQLYFPAFIPINVAQALVGSTLKKPDVHYIYMWHIRRRYGLNQSASTAQSFNLFADTCNRVIAAPRTKRGRGMAIKWQDFCSAWSERIPPTPQFERDLEAFIEACRVVNYFRVDRRPQTVRVYSRSIDSEYLLSNLFGLKTGMPGFDELFGGGGIMLTDDPTATEERSADSRKATGAKGFADGKRRPEENGVDGRKVLVIGRYGSGKSLLSLQMAVEVARKGGVAWVMSLEQPVEECLYSLAAVRQFPDERLVRIETNSVDAIRALSDTKDDRGLLFFVDDAKESYKIFLHSLQANARVLAQYREKYPLRLIVIDPINAVFRDQRVTQIRDKTLTALDEVVKDRTNLWIVSEDKGEDEEGEKLTFSFEQNIADTVIKLHNTRLHDYSLRFIEICKSRMQREQRGWHPISIKPEEGIHVTPAPAAVAARIKSRSTRPLDQPLQFGVPGMDKVLGKTGIAVGEVLIIRGPGGSMKTQMGQAFIWGGLKKQSLLIAIGQDSDRLKDDLVKIKKRLPADSRGKSIDDIDVLSFSKGYVQPGFVLQEIEGWLRSSSFDRVLVDDVRNWVLSCPFIREDSTFGDTLIELFRTYGITSCFICTEAPTDQPSALQEMIVSNADCSIQLTPYTIKGAVRSVVRVTKTRAMDHQRGLFELSEVDSPLSVEPISSLVRVDNDGMINPVSIRLFLHAETLEQERYNDHIEKVVKSTLSPSTYLEESSQMFLYSTASLGRSATIDELHLAQLDEFQMPQPEAKRDEAIPLHWFANDQWQDNLWGGLLDVLEARVRSKSGEFMALPLFCNIGLLAYKRSAVDEEVIRDWDLLAKACVDWERKNQEPNLYFDFPGETDENYNCLFWEILLAGTGIKQLKGDYCAMVKLLTSPEAVKAALIMRSLGRRAYLQKPSANRQQQPGSLRNRLAVDAKALVWRHWYTTVNDMLAGLEEAARQDIGLALLPRGVCVAGEWFVAIPQHSAAVEKGLELIGRLTSKEAELDRMNHGVGLPTRRDFYYRENANSDFGMVSPFFRLSKSAMGARIRSAFRRSSFACYSLLSPILATHLKQILKMPDSARRVLRREVKDVLASLADTLGFIEMAEMSGRCASCQSRVVKLSRKGTPRETKARSGLGIRSGRK
jgi:KaiC/GvpD/RAD55 family RecA-like ATPase